MTSYSDFAPAVEKHMRRRKYPAQRGPGNGHSRAIQVLWERGKLPPFIGWDGEGYTDDEDVHHYMLFGNSATGCIVAPDLSTLNCFEYLTQTSAENPKAIHIMFAGEYDVNMWLRDVPHGHMQKFVHYGRGRYKGYEFEHIPSKMFKLVRMTRPRIGITIYDLFTFFNCSYIRALEKFDVGSQEQRDRISSGKDKRGLFSMDDIDYVREYWTDEMSLMPVLAEHLRETCYGSGYFITSWHGPGSLASYLIKSQNVYARMGSKNVSKTPSRVKIARQYAYAGGRFHGFLVGLYEGPVYTADLNSAYVSAARELPDLARGKWEHQSSDHLPHPLPKFGLYHIRYVQQDWNPSVRASYPLWHRSKSGSLAWVPQCTGWYWGPEARLVENDPNAEIIEGWIYHEYGEREPFRSWIESAYDRRLRLQDIGDPMQQTYKWALAALYGLWARRVGWDRRRRMEPRTHQLEWAGYITSWCRAEVQRVAASHAADNSLISIDTDGITSLSPFHGIQEGRALGEWKLEEYSGIFRWQNGIYWLRKKDSDEWSAPKTRGIPRGSVPHEEALRSLLRMEQCSRLPDRGSCSFHAERTTFVGYRTAIHGLQWDRWCKWEHRNVRYELAAPNVETGGHMPMMCPRCIDGDEPMHRVITFPSLDPGSTQPHKLPWLLPDDELKHPEGALMYDWEDQDYIGIYHDADY